MSTTKAEFWELAAEMIGDEFADFTVPTTINKLGAFDYTLQLAPVTNTAVIGTIPYEYKTNQFDGDKIKVGDYMLIGQYQLIGFEPSPDNTVINAGGVALNLRRVEIDPAGASIILHVRPK